MKWKRTTSAVALPALVATIVAAIRAQRRARAIVRRPRDVITTGRRTGTSTLVACVGDSLTAGQLSANWVERLAQQLEPNGYEFVNAGINGNLAWNVLQRLDEVIACDPDVVTLLVGTNDILATLSPAQQARYRKYQRLPQQPTLEWYQQNLERILDRLATETRARVIAVELPPIGEDVDTELNRTVERYNLVLRQLCDRRDVVCLPLVRHLTNLLSGEHQPPLGAGSTRPMAVAAARRLLLRQDWDTISAKQGLALLTDHVHLNTTAADVMVDLVGDALTTPSSAP